MRSKPEPSRYLKPRNLNGPEYAGATDDEIRNKLIQKGKMGEIESQRIITEIKLILKSCNPLEILSWFSSYDALRKNKISAGDLFGSDASFEFFVELISTLDMREISFESSDRINPQIIEDIDELLRQFANYQGDVSTGELILSSKKEDMTAAKALLRMEQTYDRMQGYQSHMEKLVERIFREIDPEFKEIYGFPPSICIDILRIQAHLLQKQFLDSRDEIYKAVTELLDKRKISTKDGENLKFWLLIDSAKRQIEDNLVDQIAEHSKCSSEVVEAAIVNLTTALDPHHSIEKINQNLRTRYRPIIQFDEKNRIWCRPIDWIHGALDWMEDISSDHQALSSKYNIARQKVTPKITFEILATIFGESNTYLEPKYAAEGNPDADVLVLLPTSAILVEVKGLKFTQKGRRGDAGKIRTKYGELFLKSIEQLQRAEHHLKSEPDGWVDSRRRKINIPKIESVVSMIVTLENIDAISAWGQEQNFRSSNGRNVWPVSLSSLMAVAEILSEPHEFLNYASDRASLFQRGNPIVITETDSLDNWRRNRFNNPIFKSTNETTLPYSSDPINEYFTKSYVGISLEKPSAGIPNAISSSLNSIYFDRNIDWSAYSKAVCDVPVEKWKPVRKALNSLTDTVNLDVALKKMHPAFNTGFSVADLFSIRIVKIGSIQEPPKISGLPSLLLECDTTGQIVKSTWEPGKRD